MDEKMLILKMLENGKINAEDAYKLLNAINKSENPKNPKTAKNTYEKSNRHQTKNYLSISVEKENGRKSNVRIPVSIARLGINIGSKLSSNLNGLNINEIINTLENNSEPIIIDTGNSETIVFSLV